MGLAGRTT